MTAKKTLDCPGYQTVLSCVMIVQSERFCLLQMRVEELQDQCKMQQQQQQQQQIEHQQVQQSLQAVIANLQKEVSVLKVGPSRAAPLCSLQYF
jgi:septal ring factor EnvC (AmiA/AmiB activator)